MVPDEISHLAAEVLQLCRVGGLKMAMAESCTGGLITGCLTAVAGASDVIERGFIVYRNQAKTEMLGVPAALIATHSAVSEEVAKAMAEGALDCSAADIAAAVTGIAGPAGGTAEKPVGLVHMAAARRGSRTLHQRRVFSGQRDAVRMQTVVAVLELLQLRAQP
ncbi:MAG TPA: CinA family protein [Rhodospirillales bacterium]|nr:CinA family protein [Rhodospirillales bacterium]